MFRCSFFCFASLVFVACAGAGPYGYAPEYVPLSDEEDATSNVVEVPYEDIRRKPEDYESETVAWFGIVESISESGAVLNYRVLAPRNLCRTGQESSCRVTISAREGGNFRIIQSFRPDQIHGEGAIHRGSLLRVVGSPVAAESEDDLPALVVTYFRHWPALKFVTTNARSTMRR